jgi:hypothetical protein
MRIDLPKNLRKLLTKSDGPKIETNNIFFHAYLTRMRKARRARVILNDKSLNLSEPDQNLLRLFCVENYSSAWAFLASPALGLLLAGIFGQIVEEEYGRFWSTSVALSLLTGAFGYYFVIKAMLFALLSRIWNW